MPNQRENKKPKSKTKNTKRHGKLNKSNQQELVRQHPADIWEPTSSRSCMGRRTEDVPLRGVRERKRKPLLQGREILRPHRSCREGGTLPQLDLHRRHRDLRLQRYTP